MKPNYRRSTEAKGRVEAIRIEVGFRRTRTVRQTLPNCHVKHPRPGWGTGKLF